MTLEKKNNKRKRKIALKKIKSILTLILGAGSDVEVPLDHDRTSV